MGSEMISSGRRLPRIFDSPDRENDGVSHHGEKSDEASSDGDDVDGVRRWVVDDAVGG